MRTCKDCEKVKDLTEFQVNGKYISHTCKVCHLAKARLRYAEYHNGNRANILVRMAARYASVKQRVLNHYGSSCKCCGEDESLFLTVDHIDNDGYKLRKKNGSGVQNNIYQWLASRNMPDGFQILCMNCNQGKHRNGGICPHVSRRFNDHPVGE